MGELFTVTAFSNEHEFKVRGGVVYEVTDADQEYVDKLVAREKEQNPTFWLKVEAQ